MIKRRELCLVMGDGKAKDESGYALLYALGAIILASLVVGAIFLFAIRTFTQIDRVDKLKQSKDVGEYALQKGTQRIKDVLDDKLAVAIADKSIIFTDDGETKLKELVNSWLSDFQLEKEKIGVEKRFSYQLDYDHTKLESVKINPFVLGAETGGFGWNQDTAYQPGDVRMSVQLTFPLKVTVKEKHDGVVSTTAVSSNYNYEVQWETVDANKNILAMDVWRNVFYPYYLPDSGQNISSDEWLKKMNQLYRYQGTNAKAFEYSDYSSRENILYGEETQLLDIKDGGPLDFTQDDKKVGNLRFAGSFLVEHGAKMKGNGSSLIEISNLLALRNQSSDSSAFNFIKVNRVKAVMGTYVDLEGPNSSLVLDVNDFQTSNLLINGTNATMGAESSEGVLFSRGQLSVTKQTEADTFLFSQYALDATAQDPKTTNWSQFAKGSMVLANGSLYAGPVANADVDLTTTLEEKREIVVNGNFMMTNVLMSDASGNLDFSYFNGSQPRSPASIILEGPNTKMTVTNGISFIDSVKLSRKKSLSEYPKKEDYPIYPDLKSFSNFYDDGDYWNRIILKKGAKMELGLTGVEPFHLEVAKNSYLSFELLPENILFDDRFIVESLANGVLKGKVILQPFSINDANTLEAELSRKGIPLASVASLAIASGNTVDDGQVVIVRPSNTSSGESSRMISRTFDYIDSITY